MITKLVNLDIDKLCDQNSIKILEEAGNIIKNGGLVAFPTETVYGLGGDGLNPESSRKIYAAKGRPSDNPLIIHIADFEHLNKIVEEIPDNACKLAEAFWPGPLTMVLKKSSIVPSQTTGGLNTVAVRMPNHPVAKAFIEAAGGYIAAPSANLSGKPSPTSAKYVVQDMDGRIDMIIDGDGVDIGLESTIVDVTSEVPTILRPGFITQEMMSKVVGPVDMDVTILSSTSGQAPKAPGMKYRHYAPKGELVLVEGEPDNVVRFMNEQAALHKSKGEKTGIIGNSEYADKYIADSIKISGGIDDYEAIGRQLYTFLREFDDEEVQYMYAPSFGTNGMGQAVMNRLLKAAGHKVVNV